MTALKVIGAILLFLFLLCMLRVHAMAEYSTDGFLVKLKIGTIWISLYPRKKKKKKKKSVKKQSESPPKHIKEPNEQESDQPVEEAYVDNADAETPPQQEAPTKKDSKTKNPQKKGGSLSKFKQYLPCVGEAAGGLKRRIVIDHLTLRFVSAAQDAMSAALAFGYSNMMIGIFLPIFEQNFTVKKRNISTDVDFSVQKPTVYLNVMLSMRIGQAITLAIRLLICLIRIKQKETAQNKK